MRSIHYRRRFGKAEIGIASVWPGYYAHFVRTNRASPADATSVSEEHNSGDTRKGTFEIFCGYPLVALSTIILIREIDRN